MDPSHNKCLRQRLWRGHQSEKLDCCPTSIILTVSSEAGLYKHETQRVAVTEETGYMLSVINYAILTSNIRNDTPVVVNMKDLYKFSIHIIIPSMFKCR